MTNVFQTSAAWLGTQLQAAAGRDVYFIRGQLDPIGPVTGWIAPQTYDVIDEDGYQTTFQADDWCFPTDEMPFSPRAGDRLREFLSGEQIEYEVLPVPDRPIAEWLDTSGVLTRIHTKRVQ